jgi:GT2 family glycosyltransferase
MTTAPIRTISIVIPTVGQTSPRSREYSLVEQLVQSLLRNTDLLSPASNATGPDVEVLVVLDHDTPASVRAALQVIQSRFPALVPIELSSSLSPRFNFAERVNWGAAHSQSDLLVFMNDDMDVDDPHWLGSLVRLFNDGPVGVAGLYLRYPDGSPQHIGITLNSEYPRHIITPDDVAGEHFDRHLAAPVEVDAVTGALLAIRRETFDQVGGFSPKFAASFGDVDLCLKVRKVGLSVVLQPQASLIHLETQSRPPIITDTERHVFDTRWPQQVWPALPSQSQLDTCAEPGELAPPKFCAACGADRWQIDRILWPELVAEWELTPYEHKYVDLQQGMHCIRCKCNLRANALALAITTCVTESGPLESWISGSELRILEVNEAGSLHQFLQRAPNAVFGAYPDVDLQRLRFGNATFDLVVHSDTLEHVPDVSKALSECRRVLKPGGHLIYTVPVLVSKLSRGRADLPPSFHGGGVPNSPDLLVHTEFGADFWTPPMSAGFRSVRIFSFGFPHAVAIACER